MGRAAAPAILIQTAVLTARIAGCTPAPTMDLCRATNPVASCASCDGPRSGPGDPEPNSDPAGSHRQVHPGSHKDLPNATNPVASGRKLAMGRAAAPAVSRRTPITTPTTSAPPGAGRANAPWQQPPATPARPGNGRRPPGCPAATRCARHHKATIKPAPHSS